MRIQYVTGVYLEEYAAPANHVRGVTQATVNLAHDVSLIHPRSRPFSNSDTSVRKLATRSRTYWYPRIRGGRRFFEYQVSKHIAEEDADSELDALYFRFNTSTKISTKLRSLSQVKVLELNGLGATKSRIFCEFLHRFDIVFVDYVSGFQSHYDLEALAHAFEELVAHGTKFVAIMIGDGPPHASTNL